VTIEKESHKSDSWGIEQAKENKIWKVGFYTVWIGQAFSLVGSALVQFAVIWWLTEQTGSARTLAIATTSSMLPTIMLGPIAGALIDRWDRKWVMIGSDGLIALFTVALSILFWNGTVQIWHVYAILFLRSLADCFHNPSMVATTTLMVPKEALSRIAGLNSTLNGVVRFMAPPLGALLLNLVDVRGILPIDVITASLAILALLVVRIPRTSVPVAVDTGLRSVIQNLFFGIRYVWQRRGLRILMATRALWAVLWQPLVAFLPLLVTDYFDGGVSELGWLESTRGISMIVGGALISLGLGFKRTIANSIAGTFGFALGFLIMSLAPADSFWVAILAYSILGLAAPWHLSGLRATQQTVVAPQVQGRYFALHNSVFTALSPVALAISAPIVDNFGVRPLWIAATVGALSIALIRRLTPAVYEIEAQPVVS
jgi:DHA3 family macrolide efflux protein-like MFS transporter